MQRLSAEFQCTVYAVYFAPERTSPLWQAGCRWLGRDPERETALPPVSISGLGSDAVQEITADARRYGFHATLKPPFRLADGVDQDALARATSNLAAHLNPFQAPPLILEDLDGFMALTLSAPSPEMQALADAAVIELDRFRAPPAATELARRRRAGLSDPEEERLGRWGYPYVLEGFRFHLTLTRGSPMSSGRSCSRNWRTASAAASVGRSPSRSSAFMANRNLARRSECCGDFRWGNRFVLTVRPA